VSQRHGRTGTVFQEEIPPALRYFTELGNCSKEAAENIMNPMYSTSLRDHQTLCICDHRNMPVCQPLPPLSILHFVWLLSLLAVPSPLGLLGAGREDYSL